MTLIHTHRYKYAWLLTLVPLVLGGTYFIKTSNSFEYQLKKNGVQILGAENFILKEVTENKIFAERDNEILKIEIIKNINEPKAKEYLKNQTALLKGMFEPQLPPYPEFLTKQTGCAERYKPQEKQAPYGKYFILFAGSRFGYGICVEDLIEYKASLGYFYCPNKDTLFRVEYFTGINEDFSKLINFNDSLVCK